MARQIAPTPRYCTEVYNWRWHYYFLTNEGIEFLRQELHLPAQVLRDGCWEAHTGQAF